MLAIIDEHLRCLPPLFSLTPSNMIAQSDVLAKWIDDQQLPFRNQLHRLFGIDPQYKEHGVSVLQAMNALLSGRPEHIFERASPPNRIVATLEQKKRLRQAISAVALQFDDSWDGNMQAVFRVAALYHDIGKYITRERHPVVGWMMVKYMYPEETQDFAHLLSSNNDFLQIVMAVIRHHDEFGVISTGEASKPILVRATGYPNLPAAESKRLISALMVCSLADMVGTFEVDGDATDTLIKDWQWYLDALDTCERERRPFDEYVANVACERGQVVERIRRLLLQSSRRHTNTYEKLHSLESGVLTGRLNEAVDTVFGTAAAVDEFAYTFTHICKLDYGKRFFEQLIGYGESNKRSDEDILYDFFAILKRIATTYRAMIRSDFGSGNLIGVELKDLTPESSPDKARRIVELITKSHYPGLTWMMSDIPAWYY